MRKNFSLFILALLVILTTKGHAQEVYNSSLYGFSLNQSNTNSTIVVTGNMVTETDDKMISNGIYAFTAEDIAKYAEGTVFSTEKFNQDLRDIEVLGLNDEALRTLAKDPKYAYFNAINLDYKSKFAEMVNMTPMLNFFLNEDMPVKATYEVTVIKGQPALRSTLTAPINYIFTMPVSYSKEQQAAIKADNPAIRFSKDGKTMSFKLLVNADTYIFSLNDRLYYISSNYFETKADKKNTTAKVQPRKTQSGSPLAFPLFNNAISKADFEQSLVNFAGQLNFFAPPVNGTDELRVTDQVFAQGITLPNNWLYTQGRTQFANEQGSVELEAFFATPLATFQNILNDIWNNNMMKIEYKKDVIEVTADLSEFIQPSKLLGAFSEGLIGVSGTINQPEADKQIAMLLNRPEETKMSFDLSFQQLLMYTMTSLQNNKYFRVDNLTQNMQINRDNCLVELNYKLDLNVPLLPKISELKTAKKAKEKPQDLPLQNLLLNGQTKIYFNKNNEFNVLTYFRQGKIGQDPIVYKSLSEFNLWQ